MSHSFEMPLSPGSDSESWELLADSTGSSDERKPVWWAEQLLKHSRTLGMVIPTLSSPVKCLSSCTGSFAEGFVFEDRFSKSVCVFVRIVGRVARQVLFACSAAQFN